MIRLQIISGDIDTDGLVFASFWNNLFEASGGTTSPWRTGLFRWQEVDRFVLENYNGRVIFDYESEEFGDAATCIEFDAEEEATVFLLRWA